MQFSENWLRTMVNPSLSTDELAHLMTMSGLEVEEIKPAAKPFSKIVVAKVLSVEKHPNADRLSVCQVDAGTGEVLNIVCGAPNVKAGMLTGCALVGAQLPTEDENKPFTIKKGKLRGVESNGMLCSLKELQLTNDHSGIMELSENATIGQDLRDYFALEDVIFDIKLTPDEADCLSVLGIAREVSALTGAAFTPPQIKKADVQITDTQKVVIKNDDLCGRFSGRIIKNINAKAATPDWMVRRLERSGQRSVSALVDISNYVMLEGGHPNHMYDLDKITGELTVRWGKPGEKVKLLNGNEVEVDETVGVIADETGVESLAGIMGGDKTSISLDTTNIFIEAAFWWPDAIRGRARRYNFATDASHRFERGVDFADTTDAIERMSQLIIEICGTEKTQVGPIDDQVTKLPERKAITLRASRAQRVIGITLDNAQIADIFKRLKLEFTQNGDVFTVIPPSYRFDLEIEEDLIEEIARVYGFENIPALPPVAKNVMRIKPEATRSLFSIRHQMADMDYQEVVNYSFVEEEWEKDFADNNDPIRLLNPIASQMSVMRSNMIGNLVANVAYNVNRKVPRIRLFEIGLVFSRDESVKDSPTSVANFKQPKHLAAIAYGGEKEDQWGEASRQVDFFDVKGDLEALFAPQKLTFKKETHPALHPGRSAGIYLNNTKIGVIGELHPNWQQKYDLPRPAIVFEVQTDALQQVGVPEYKVISHFPPVVRDMALVVDNKTSASSLIERLMQEKEKNESCAILQSIVLFDEYRGVGLGENEKSLAFRLTLQAMDKTLEDKDADGVVAALFSVAQEAFGAKLRG